MLLKIYDENPSRLKPVIDCLKNGGVIIYPTDTVYAIGCDINNKQAIDRVSMIKGVKTEKVDYSFIFHDLSHLSEYTRQVDTSTFKMLKKNLPGPFTFILNANNSIPKLFKNKKKTVGIRIPDNNITRAIVEQFGNPIISTSVYDDDEVIEYTTDPELIHEKYEDLVDMVIDGGIGKNEASTVVDLTSGQFEIIRQGAGELQI